MVAAAFLAAAVPSVTQALPTIFPPVQYGDWGAFTGGIDQGIFAGRNSQEILLPPQQADPSPGGLGNLDYLAASHSQSDSGFHVYNCCFSSALIQFEGDVSRGVIHAFASGFAGETGELPGGGGLAAGSGVKGDLGWYDTITVKSPSADASLQISLHTFANTLQSTGISGGLHAGVAYHAGYSNTLEIYRVSQSGNQLISSLGHCEGTGPATRGCTGRGGSLAVMTVHRDEQLLLIDHLTFEGVAETVWAGKASFELDLLDSAYFTLDPETPGESIITGSGIDYASSVFPPKTGVPEPATLGLMGLGFAALGIARVTARKRRVTQH
jgi:hypothetical protein